MEFARRFFIPRLRDETVFHCEHYGDYILCPGRINEVKRQHLLVEAMRFVQSSVRVVIAGKPESQEYSRRLERIVKEYHLEDKVELRMTFLSEEEKIALYAGALATAYVPFCEDSYGYVTLESYYSRKAVITCIDSGGILDVVHDSISGYVVAPTASSLASAMDCMMLNRSGAEDMGGRGLQNILDLNISWDHVIKALTE